jgi:ADP-heptose:LPS heptosyltransferase
VRFAAVGDRLAESGARVVVTGTSDERGLVEEVLGRMDHDAVEGCDRLSLNGLVGLLSRAAVLVSNDTGPLHLAAALGVATAGIFWCGNMVNGAPLTRARHRAFPAWLSSCPVCGRRASEPRCEHDPSFVDEVQVDDVIAAALDLWTSRPA